MTTYDHEWLFNVKIRFRSAFLKLEHLYVENNTASAVFYAPHDQLARLDRHVHLTPASCGCQFREKSGKWGILLLDFDRPTKRFFRFRFKTYVRC